MTRNQPNEASTWRKRHGLVTEKATVGSDGTSPDPVTALPTVCSTARCRPAAGEWLVFLLVNGLLLGMLFGPAMIGRALLAPLDIPPNFFPKFRYMDPSATGIPANHYVIDLVFGDVSRNLLVHEAFQRGEMPWWDPYTNGGKPLGAEANAVNISDPLKVLLFHLLPFELAYNWARILPFLLSGVLAFRLMRHFGFAFMPSLWSGLLYEFAACHTLMFSGPTVQASFAYYPLLWLLWDKGVAEKRLYWFLLSALVTTLVFLSGNLQSHSYVFLFALAFALAYGWRQPERWRLLLTGIIVATGSGLLLASPFLLSQIELFFLSVHPPQAYNPLAGPLSLSAFFPWLLGTFRTIDASKLVAQSNLGFMLYIGSAALVVSTLGMFVRVTESRDADFKRTALLLVGAYFIICSTPLIRYFYTRMAPLAVLGLVGLLALGWRRLEQRPLLRRTGVAILAGATGLIVILHAGVWWVYPRVQPAIETRLLARDQNHPGLDSSPVLRRFQLQNLPNEMTFRNPEVLAAYLGLVALGALLLFRPAATRWWFPATLALSTLPLLLYAHRYIPMHPISQWQRLRAGGPEQQRVMQSVNPGGQRLIERAPGWHDYVFPGALAQLFRVHVLQGHTSLTVKRDDVPNPRLHHPVRGNVADYEYRSAERGITRGELVPLQIVAHARFFWDGPQNRPIKIIRETLNTIELELASGPAGDLIRTDTFYPGWRVASPRGLSLTPEPPCFARLQVPADVTRLELRYEPRWWRTGLGLAGAAGVALAAGLVLTRRRPKATSAPSFE